MRSEMAAAVRSMPQSSLWKKYFEDPSQWWDNRITKSNQRVPDFKHKASRQGLWIDGCPSWVHEELRRRSQRVMLTENKAGAHLVGKEKHEKSSKAVAINFVASLKACAKKKDLRQGAHLHTDIQKMGLLRNNPYVASSLISMYAKCGALPKAQEVLDKLPVRNVVSWSALITGYVQQGQAKEALNCFERMQGEGLSPDAVSFICILKACGSIGDVAKGKQIHDEIVRQGLLGEDIVLGTALVTMYVKCGDLAKARQVLKDLPARDAFSWSVMISGYAQQGQGEEALNCFECMRREGLSPDAVTFISILKACGSIRAVDKGKEIHDEINREGLLRKDIVLGTALVDMYAKCGVLSKAQQVLDEFPVRNIISWNVLITGYTQQGQAKEALKCYERLQHEGLSPSAFTFSCILKACGSLGAADKGRQIHDEIASQGLLGKDIVLGNALVDMYAKCGLLAKARKVLEELPVRDVVSWSAVIAGYTQQGLGEEALNCFEQMLCEGLSPNAITFICILKACGSVGAIDKGKKIHDEILNRGLLGKDILLGNALVYMYAKCGVLPKAREVLDKLLVRDVVSWSTLIAEYARQGQGEEALSCFAQMQREGLSPDAVTFSCILKACGSVGALDKGKQIHDEIVRQGLPRKDVVLGTALVCMYANCGVLEKAREVLDDLLIRDVVAWSALIIGYVQQGQGEEALSCFERMQREGLFPDEVTFACILKACGSIGAIDKGKQIHDEIFNQGLLKKSVVLGNALVDMYAKCGELAKAHKVLDGLPVRDVVSWNALIAGYAQQGLGEETLNCFERMQCDGASPDALTLTSVLNTCSHSGLLDEGEMYFTNMKVKYGITPDNEHHACMVDLFGRAGHFDKALAIIKQMPSFDHPPVWSALLGACRKWDNVEIGRLAFEHAVRVDKHDSAAYVCMANIYAAAGMQEEAGKIEIMRKRNGARKIPGRSRWIDGSGNVHSFPVGDTKHAQSKDIYAKLQDIALKMSQEGYSPRLEWVSQNILDDEKKSLLCGHSEKLAIACALINTPQGASIHVVKNMRICGDCHAATSLISKLEKRKIVVRDANRAHIFESGKCSCGDYF